MCDDYDLTSGDSVWQTDHQKEVKQLARTLAEEVKKNPNRVSEVLQEIAKQGNQIIEMEFRGEKIKDNKLYKEQFEIAIRFFDDLYFCLKDFKTAFSAYMKVQNSEFVTLLSQLTEVILIFDREKDRIYPKLRSWIILNFYSQMFELGVRSYATILATFSN